MQIVNKKIEELKGYEFNARTHSNEQIREIVDSIKTFGFLDPIEIDQNNVIISGHARLAAAQLLQMTEVPTITHNHLNETGKKGYILAANRIAMNAGWDHELLKHEFTDLMQNEFDATLTGFSQREIDEIMLSNEELQEIEGGEESTGLPETPKTVLGDVWVLGNHRLMCGDSTNPLSVECLLGDNKPIAMITDPPYGVKYDPEWRDGADLGVGERSTGKVQNDDRADWREAYSLFTGDVAYVWHAGVYSPDVGQHLKDCGFDLINQIIWNKQHFALSRGDYHWKHEPCWYAVRSTKKHNWQGARDQSTVWDIKNNNSFGNSNVEETWGHGTQKPIECMLRPIQNNTKQNDYVYDPFGGSGTTLIACEKSHRRCLMMEIDEKYCDVIIKRWQKLTGKKAILESTGESFDEIEIRTETQDSNN